VEVVDPDAVDADAVDADADAFAAGAVAVAAVAESVVAEAAVAEGAVVVGAGAVVTADAAAVVDAGTVVVVVVVVVRAAAKLAGTESEMIWPFDNVPSTEVCSTRSPTLTAVNWVSTGASGTTVTASLSVIPHAMTAQEAMPSNASATRPNGNFRAAPSLEAVSLAEVSRDVPSRDLPSLDAVRWPELVGPEVSVESAIRHLATHRWATNGQLERPDTTRRWRQ
jgi:hypothetical protein